MPLKVILNVDPETGEANNFPWAEKEEPPPLVRPRVKKRPLADDEGLDKEEKKPS